MANNDIETESLLDPNFNQLNSPTGSHRVGADNIHEGSPRDRNRASGKDEEEDKRTDKDDKAQAQSARALGEQIMNNANTIKSKSLTHSHVGGQDSDNTRRLQEALQSKKEANKELNAKLLKVQAEQEL